MYLFNSDKGFTLIQVNTTISLVHPRNYIATEKHIIPAKNSAFQQKNIAIQHFAQDITFFHRPRGSYNTLNTLNIMCVFLKPVKSSTKQHLKKNLTMWKSRSEK